MFRGSSSDDEEDIQRSYFTATSSFKSKIKKKEISNAIAEFQNELPKNPELAPKKKLEVAKTSKYLDSMMEQAKLRNEERNHKLQVKLEQKRKEDEKTYGQRATYFSKEYREVMEEKGTRISDEMVIPEEGYWKVESDLHGVEYLNGKNADFGKELVENSVIQGKDEDEIPYPELTMKDVDAARKRYLERKRVDPML